ncbi:hypothetical protein AYI95_02400 [Shewanella xiamenensis]|nr:hypothetical protein AYI95_02400 [Shewanella xiamenensis]
MNQVTQVRATSCTQGLASSNVKLLSHELIESATVKFWRRKQKDVTYLFKQIADNTKATSVHHPLGVAAGRIDKLRESRHGWRASFRRCRDASFGSDSKFGYEHKGLSTPLGVLADVKTIGKEDRTSSPPWSTLD